MRLFECRQGLAAFTIMLRAVAQRYPCEGGRRCFMTARSTSLCVSHRGHMISSREKPPLMAWSIVGDGSIAHRRFACVRSSFPSAACRPRGSWPLPGVRNSAERSGLHFGRSYFLWLGLGRQLSGSITVFSNAGRSVRASYHRRKWGRCGRTMSMRTNDRRKSRRECRPSRRHSRPRTVDRKASC